MHATSQAHETTSREVPRAERMRAVVYDRYGSFDQLAVREIDKPSVAADQVLVRVYAAALHVGDCFSVKGRPLGMRLATGLRRPRHGIPGFDLAGVVEAVGEKVTQFQRGDAVFGASFATCAEYVCARAEHLALKPSNFDFERAAALPTSGLTALQTLRDAAKLRPGQKILIIGAAGGIGHFAVQLAKSYGAEVTGVCGPHSAAMLRSIGADHVVDYTREDFAQAGPRYDVIFDNIENRSLADCRRALTPDGMLLLNSGRGADGIPMLIRLLKPLVLSRFSRQTLRRHLTKTNHADLVVLKELSEAGKLTPVIERRYPLQETAEALRMIDAGHVRGKLVISVSAPAA